MPASSRPVPSPPRILLVEDDDEVRGLIAAHLERTISGVQVIEAPTAKQGLKALEENDVSLILSDFHLPDMNGLDFLTRAKRAFPYAKRVMLTGDPEEGLAVQASREAGVERFFVKPLRMESFTQAVKGLLAPAGRAP